MLPLGSLDLLTDALGVVLDVLGLATRRSLVLVLPAQLLVRGLLGVVSAALGVVAHTLACSLPLGRDHDAQLVDIAFVLHYDVDIGGVEHLEHGRELLESLEHLHRVEVLEVLEVRQIFEAQRQSSVYRDLARHEHVDVHVLGLGPRTGVMLVAPRTAEDRLDLARRGRGLIALLGLAKRVS